MRNGTPAPFHRTKEGTRARRNSLKKKKTLQPPTILPSSRVSVLEETNPSTNTHGKVIEKKFMLKNTQT